MLLNGRVCSAPAVRGCCALHGIVVVDDGNFGDALLRHCFTGFCALAWDDAMHLACWEVCHALWSRARTGSKQLQSLVDAGALLPVATERRRNTLKRGGAAGPMDNSVGRPAFAESSVGEI